MKTTILPVEASYCLVLLGEDMEITSVQPIVGWRVAEDGDVTPLLLTRDWTCSQPKLICCPGGVVYCFDDDMLYPDLDTALAELKKEKQ